MLHRAMWIHVPNGLRSVDQWLTNGRLSASVVRIAYILWNDRHPTVMVRGADPYDFSFMSSHYSWSSPKIPGEACMLLLGHRILKHRPLNSIC